MPTGFLVRLLILEMPRKFPVDFVADATVLLYTRVYAHICLPINFISSTYYARCDVTEREVERVNESEYTVWKKRNAKATARSEAAEGASGSGARGAFKEGLRFRRLAHEQECHSLTAEWELGESMIGTAIACQRSHCRSCFAFFSPLGGQWKSGRKYHCSITLKIIVTFGASRFVHVHEICKIYRLPSPYRSTE